MKKTTFLFIAFLIAINLHAQDSLRLTLKLDGFKEKDRLTISLSEGGYRIPTDKEELTITRKLKSPEPVAIIYKSRVQSFWIDNNDIEVTISKSDFKKGIEVKGSPSERLWQQIISTPKEKRAQILEQHIDGKVAQSYLAGNSDDLLPEDKKRLLGMSGSETVDYTKYNVSLIGLDTKGKLKAGDPMMDFTASTIDNQITSTKDLRGKYILLDFAGTGCGWCWITYPQMAETLVQYKDLQVLTINQDYEHEKWQKIADSKKVDLPWPILWKAENKQEIFETYGVQVLPTYYLISPQGIILERWQGGKDERIERRLAKHSIN